MNNQRVYGLRGVAQALKHLPSKAKALSSNSILLKIGFLKTHRHFINIIFVTDKNPNIRKGQIMP
jgi:hypothetical protein